MKRVSIVIATFNSQRLLGKVLESIKKQTYPSSNIEILVVDGGSSDATRKIARRYGCKIIDNPKTLPAWAKFIGYTSANGDYIMYLDSDEVIENADSIQRKVEVFQNCPSVHAITGSGYKSPTSYPFLNRYINEFGDPFSFFIYSLSKDNDFFIDSMKRKYEVIDENNDRVIFDFSRSTVLPIFELVAMASMVDLRYVKKNFPEIVKNPGLIPHIFNLLVSKNIRIAIVKDDPLTHYSSDSLRGYLNKITSRVIGNVFSSAKEGFRGRNEFVSGMAKYKKYVFLPYAFSVVFPFLDSFYLSYTRKNLGYFVHVPLCVYTASLIVYYSCVRLLGFRPTLKSYGQSHPVYR